MLGIALARLARSTIWPPFRVAPFGFTPTHVAELVGFSCHV